MSTNDQNTDKSETPAPSNPMTLLPPNSKSFPWTKFQIAYALSMKLPDFTPNDWDTWSKQVIRQFASAGLDSVVIGIKEVPDITDVTNYGNYYDQCRQATTKLLDSIPTNLRQAYVDYELPSELWTKLHREYGIKSSSLIIQTFMDLFNLKMRDDDIESHITKMDSLHIKLAALRGSDGGLTDPELQTLFLASISDSDSSWQTFASSVAGRSEESYSYSDLCKSAREHARRSKNFHGSSTFFAHNSPASKPLHEQICFNFNKPSGCTFEEQYKFPCKRIHKCAMCHESNHPVQQCPKLATKDEPSASVSFANSNYQIAPAKSRGEKPFFAGFASAH
jgi:hypothetical protein